MAVNGKQKGSSFEREVCKQLSLWVTHGKNVDVFWRSAMSGGRATVKAGLVRQAGDITAVAPEGHILTDHLYFECKHLKEITFDSLIKRSGALLPIWYKTIAEAEKYNRYPVLIFRQNHWPVVFCAGLRAIDYLKIPRNMIRIRSGGMCALRFDEVLATKFLLSEAN